MVELDINGMVFVLSDAETRCLCDAAALQAGRSQAARNLSLLLERGLKQRGRIALQRGERRTIRSLVENDPESRASSDSPATKQTLCGRVAWSTARAFVATPLEFHSSTRTSSAGPAVRRLFSAPVRASCARLRVGGAARVNGLDALPETRLGRFIRVRGPGLLGSPGLRHPVGTWRPGRGIPSVDVRARPGRGVTTRASRRAADNVADVSRRSTREARHS
jgi:hypothetical protein